MRRGHGRNIEGDKLRGLAAEVFGSASAERDKVLVSFGAIERMLAWTDGKMLYVDMTMKTGAPDDVVRETITRNNRFLERATGYSAKERAKKAQAAAKKGTA